MFGLFFVVVFAVFSMLVRGFTLEQVLVPCMNFLFIWYVVWSIVQITVLLTVRKTVRNMPQLVEKHATADARHNPNFGEMIRKLHIAATHANSMKWVSYVGYCAILLIGAYLLKSVADEGSPSVELNTVKLIIAFVLLVYGAYKTRIRFTH